MNFEELRDFLASKMRMNHIYQPLLIRSLIDAGGSATIRQLAVTFLSQDEYQIKYYERSAKRYATKILKKHGLITMQGDLVSLNLTKLTLVQKAELKKLCEEKLQEFVANRGLALWEYRFLDVERIPDSLRNRVLREAKGRCALCGATNKELPLDVDHIIPRSKGGKTIYENLQILCAKCNRSKGNRDQYDFRDLLSADIKAGCIFCARLKDKDCFMQNELAYSTADLYPVTQGHTLFIPKRHVTDYFDTTENERKAMNDLLQIRRRQLLEKDNVIAGFNVGINCGEAAGQTISHCHIHLIPRRSGDVEDPIGGVRCVIPDKRLY